MSGESVLRTDNQTVGKSSNLKYLGIVLEYLAFGWMIFSAIAFSVFDNRLIGGVFALIGLITLGLAALQTRTIDIPYGTSIPVEPMGYSRRILIASSVLLLLLAEISGQMLPLAQREFPTHAQHALWILALLSIGLSFFLRNPIRLRITLRIEWVLVAAITAVGFGLRYWQLEDAVHQFVDEMNFGRAVWYAQTDNSVPLIAPFSPVTTFPWVYPFWQMLVVPFFGNSLTTLRFVSAVFGTLTIPAVYLLVFEIVDSKTAIVSALILATFPPHLHFSRLGMNNIVDPFLGTLLFLFLIRGLKYQKQMDYVLAGIFLGLTQYFYEGGRLLYPVLALTWLEMSAMLRLVRLDRAVARRLFHTIGLGVLVAFPVYYVLLVRGHSLIARFSKAGLGGSYFHALQDFNLTEPFLKHVLQPFLIYVDMPELSLFYGGGQALILPLLVPFFLFGCAYVLVNWRKPGFLLLTLWVLGTSVGSMLLAVSGEAARFVVVFPALAILIAIGITCVFRWRILVVLVVISLAFSQVHYYFNEHLPLYNQELRSTLDAQDAIFRLEDFPYGTVVCFVSNIIRDEALLGEIRDYVAPQVKLCHLTAEEATPERIADLPEAPVKVFFVEPDDDAVINFLRERLPTSLEGPLFSPYETVPLDRQYALYYTGTLR